MAAIRFGAAISYKLLSHFGNSGGSDGASKSACSSPYAGSRCAWAQQTRSDCSWRAPRRRSLLSVRDGLCMQVGSGYLDITGGTEDGISGWVDTGRRHPASRDLGTRAMGSPRRGPGLHRWILALGQAALACRHALFAGIKEPQISPLRYAPVLMTKAVGRHGSPLYAKSGRRMGHPKPWLPMQRRRVIPFPTRLREWAARDDKVSYVMNLSS